MRTEQEIRRRLENSRANEHLGTDWTKGFQRALEWVLEETQGSEQTKVIE